jgi:hypothetical protein
MKEEDYIDFDLHAHPSGSTVVEIVAYQRNDRSWDVFIYEPKGSIPEMESLRTDEGHIFYKNIPSSQELDKVADEIEQRLGEGYCLVPYYRERGTRRTLDRIFDHLRRHGAHGMWLHGDGPDEWVIRIRRKDIVLAEQVVRSNINK